MPEVILNGPEGRLEGRYQHGRGENPPVALVLHPHPQHDGNMNNKVVYSVFHTFTSMGFSTLRFNFRGVGRSQGEYDFGTGSSVMQRPRLIGCRVLTETRGRVGQADFLLGLGYLSNS